MKPVRCAIYTRKSSEEGLEQGFNSLDAQREACSAYILSQASEGWSEVRDRYDDGGLSGGTLERPALQRLLADIAAGKVHIIVVYKVDRLTRSLLDFAKLVEALDKAGTSFVSITQSFNTTTSMGRLTLNMLLSFAQFEREVTAERIRDKIAASKAKGMWMGGIPPLGYRPDGRSLAIVEDHARLVRTIFERYLEVGNVRELAQRLARDGLLSPARTLSTGKTIGGGAFSRGQLYLMLKCRTYIGQVVHKAQRHRGLHPAIMDAALFDRVQEMLADNRQGARAGAGAAQSSLLAGRIADEAGEPLIATHACVGRRRYRYYVSQALHHARTTTGMRLPAREVETVVAEKIASMLGDPIGLLAQPWLSVSPTDYSAAVERAGALADQVRRGERGAIRDLICDVRVGADQVLVEVLTAKFAEALNLDMGPDAPSAVTLVAKVRLARSGRAIRLVHADPSRQAPRPNTSLVRLLAQAHRLWAELRKGTLNVTMLAAKEGMSPAYLTRVVRLAFLSPTVTDAILAGRQKHDLKALDLTLRGAIPSRWSAQEAILLPALVCGLATS